MSREQLWAPWRLAYIKGTHGRAEGGAEPAATAPLLPGGEATCFLCRAAADVTRDRDHLVVHRGPTTLTILNRYPYNNGHVLVAPLVHRGRLDELPAEVQAECQAEIARLVPRMERLLEAHGFNVGLNLGRVAGAGVPGHLHWHLVPRWPGDTNFMPVVADLSVMSQSLAALWELLHEPSGSGTPEA